MKRVLAPLVVLAALLLGGWAWRCFPILPANEVADAATFRVRRGPLDIVIRESGTLKSREQVVIKNELEGRTTLIFLIPEGTRVKEGDLLAELDASRLVDQQADQISKVREAEAAHVRARETLEVVKLQVQSDVEQQELQKTFADEDLKNYLDGEYPNVLHEAEARIAIAEEELQRNTDRAKWSRVLFGEKYLSETELLADDLAQKRSGLEVQLAKDRLKLLKEFTYARRVADLKGRVRQGELTLEKMKRKGKSDILQAEADLKSKEADLDRAKDKLKKLEEQIAKARIVAPKEGLVVYATSVQTNWRGNVDPLAEGQDIRERQDLIYLPAPGAMAAQLSIQEAMLSKAHTGLSARIKVDALPGQNFEGVLDRISPLPDAHRMFMNADIKVYPSEVFLSGNAEGLRNGMSCQVEIAVTSYDNVLQAPLQVVVRHKGRPAVIVRAGAGFAPQEVEVGLDDGVMVHLIKGVREGQEILLAPAYESTVEPEANGLGPKSGPGSAAALAQPPIPENHAVAEAAPPPGHAREERSGSTEGQAAKGKGEKRRRFENMTPEQREEMLRNLTPEQREALRARRERAAGGGERAPAGE